MDPARWLAPTALAAGLAGLVVSVYLTVVHFMTDALVCSVTGFVNCERVLSSPYGVVASSPVPTAAAGIVWFGVSAALAALRMRRGETGALPTLHLGWAAVGLLTVLGLVYIEIDRLGAVCAWCTVAHALVLITFLTTLPAWQLRERGAARGA